jgi:hypothetical protein
VLMPRRTNVLGQSGERQSQREGEECAHSDPRAKADRQDTAFALCPGAIASTATPTNSMQYPAFSVFIRVIREKRTSRDLLRCSPPRGPLVPHHE